MRHRPGGFQDIVAKAGVDVHLTNHSGQDKTLDKIAALKSRKPGGSHPFFVGNEAMKRFMTVVSECANAQYTWLTTSAN